jgi:hypothetical protein
MGVHKVVRYVTSAESADENARLVAAVYAELATTSPAGLSYATYRLDDGVTFVHVAELSGEENPLQSSAAFAAFQAGLGGRCVEPPVAADAVLVGSYRHAAG